MAVLPEAVEVLSSGSGECPLRSEVRSRPSQPRNERVGWNADRIETLNGTGKAGACSNWIRADDIAMFLASMSNPVPASIAWRSQLQRHFAQYEEEEVGNAG